jgi:hypothetical protein
MQKIYKCKNGHKFKKEEEKSMTCPTCNEHAEPIQWQTVDEFPNIPFGFGLKKELGYIVKTLRGK